MADISNPAKDWELHRQWTSRIMEEFFCQVGDLTVFFIISSFLFFLSWISRVSAFSNSKYEFYISKASVHLTALGQIQPGWRACRLHEKLERIFREIKDFNFSSDKL